MPGWMRRVLPLIVLFLLIPAVALADARVMVVSDIHYISPALYAGSDLFVRSVAQGDGKMSHASDVLLRALKAEVLRERPDALVITGDLTFNGERKSHEELAAACAELEAEGIPVWVIPGNHDINNPVSRRFSGSGYTPAENVDPEAFQRIWAGCMNPAETGESFSYTVEVNDRVRLALLDVSIYRDAWAAGGLYTPAHQAWLRNALAQAAAQSAAVVAAVHQSVIPHTSLAPESFSVMNGGALREDLRRGGVSLCLTGHIHIQHLMTENGLTDAATGAFSVYPHRYGWVTVGEDGTAVYEMRSLSPEHLPVGFLEESAAFFDRLTADKLRPALAALALSPEETEQMLDYAVRFNRAYFSGTLDAADPAWRDDPARALWQRHMGQAGFGAYMEMTFRWEDAHRRGTD